MSTTENDNGSSPDSEKAKAVASGRSAPVKRLPTPRIAFANQLNILRAYGAASDGGNKAVGHKEVASILGMSSDTVSLANAFLADVGLITKAEGGYLPSPETVAFARVYQWEPEKASQELAPKIRETWFAETLLNRLGFAPMDEQAAVTELAKVAQADTGYRQQLQTLLEYLEASGLVALENGQVQATANTTKPAPPPAEPKPGPSEQGQATPAPRAATPTTTTPLLVQGLLQQLPSGETWTEAGMDDWLELAKKVFQVVYKIPLESHRPGDS